MSSITSINGVSFFYCPVAKIAFQLTEVSTVKLVEGSKDISEEETEVVKLIQVKLKDGEIILLANSKDCYKTKGQHQITNAEEAPDLYAELWVTFKFSLGEQYE